MANPLHWTPCKNEIEKHINITAKYLKGLFKISKFRLKRKAADAGV